MEELSQMRERKGLNVRKPVFIEIHPYLMDHRFAGHAVLPAVEAMQLLAASVEAHHPGTDVSTIIKARFDKFLPIPQNETIIEAFDETELLENGNMVSKLITIFQARKAAITRAREHVTLSFSKRKTELLPNLPTDLCAALEGVCFQIQREKIYRDLVPFGPAYQNIRGILHISENGAIARVRAPDHPHGCLSLSKNIEALGSPFPLDAAFHAACAWGQRFSGIVPFPVGFEKRHVLIPTCAGEEYICKIIPVQSHAPLLIFDIWIHDLEGRVCEALQGVQMRDVSGGRMKPPEWIMAPSEPTVASHKSVPVQIGTAGLVSPTGAGKAPEPVEGKTPLKHLSEHCQALSVIELETVQDFADKALSDQELIRFAKMRDKRGRSYLAARLCCKSLSRKLSGNDLNTSPQSITTVSPDLIRPRCPMTDGSLPFSCSVSHDSRFAIAVASESRIGVDVERASERVLKGQKFYMNEAEQSLAKVSSLGEIQASLRVWSIKEAVSKALDIKLTDAWHSVRVTDIGSDKSRILIDKERRWQYVPAFHDTVDDHVFTLVILEKQNAHDSEKN